MPQKSRNIKVIKMHITKMSNAFRASSPSNQRREQLFTLIVPTQATQVKKNQQNTHHQFQSCQM